jgi:two-component sensor histidine kinase
MSSHRSILRDEIVTTAELERRPTRPQDHLAESLTLARLMQAMAAHCAPAGHVASSGLAHVLQQVADAVRALSGAHSAGINILEREDGQERFRWLAATGLWALRTGDIMPRESSSGTALDTGAAVLTVSLVPYAASAQGIAPPIAEALVVPFHLGGQPVGTIWAVSHDEGCRFDAEDRRLLTSLGQIAANVCHLLGQGRLTSELAATRRLQEISTQLLGEGRVELLYEKLMDAAVAIMRSDFASMQMLYPERGDSGELRLLAFRGFSPEAARFWTWVRADSGSTCAAALRTCSRVVAPDVEQCDLIVGTEDLETYLRDGIRAVQTTPLVSRDGKLLGMISTHWRQPHHPSEQDLGLLDVLARQAADLIERSLAEQRTQMLLREVSHRGKNLLSVVQAMVRQTADEESRAFAETFSARLVGLAASQELLVQSDWRGARVNELVRTQLSHVRDLIGTRVTLDGPSLRLIPPAAQTIGMAVHELATNAAKYGALSNGEGTIAITWRVVLNGARPGFAMSWRERGGPAVAPPQRRGFGHSVTVRMVEHALDGEVKLAYDPAGVQWRMVAPASAVFDEDGVADPPQGAAIHHEA